MASAILLAEAACASGAIEPSHVVRAMKGDGFAGQQMVRFSMDSTTTELEVLRALEFTVQAVTALRG